MEQQEANQPIDQSQNVESTPVAAKDVAKAAVRSGVILGVVSIIITLLLYLIDGALLANIGIGFGILALLLILVVVFGINYRKSVGNALSYLNAFLFCLVVLVVGGLIGNIFNYILFNFIDPDLVDLITKASIDNTVSLMERFGADQNAIDEAITRTEEQLEGQYTFGGIAKQYLYSWIAYVLISALGGAIVWKRPVEEEI